MKNNELPLILTNKTPRVNLDFSKINTFEGRFSKLKKALLSSNIKTMKKVNSQNSYIPKNDNNSVANNIDPTMNEKKEDKENNNNNNNNYTMEDAVYRADCFYKFKKIKLNLFKNKLVQSEQETEKKNNTNKRNSFYNKKGNSEEDNKYIFQKYFWNNKLDLKNDLNYDIGGNIESDPDDYIELEPERYKFRDIKNINLRGKDKKINMKKNILYLTELQNMKNDLEYPLPIKNKRSNLNSKLIKNNYNIKQIKITSDKQEKYKNPFIFERYSSLNNISHFHKLYRSFKNICRKHYVKGDSPSYAFIKSCEKEKIVCNPLGLLKRWGNEGSLDMNNQHLGDKYVNCLSSSLKFVNHLNTLEMSNNRLSNNSIEKLFNNIKQNENLLRNLIKLNLSFNHIKEKGIQNLINFIEDKNCQLEHLNLEGNILGDNNINNLCYSISEYLGNRLNYINLGKNKITKNSEEGLLLLTNKCSELVVLNLKNNQINNLLASKIIINLNKLYSLKVLDFSWNLIGDHLIYPYLYEEAVNFYPNQKNLYNNFELDKIKTNMKIIFNKNPLLPNIDPTQNKKEKTNEEEEINTEIKSIKVPERKPSPFAAEFAAYIKNHLCPLVHINISHNNLPYIDCKLISEESKDNHNILGFHVDGNEMKIDQFGFIIPIKKEQKNRNFYSKSQILYEAENFKDIPQVLSSRFNKIRNSNNCWVCECWNEVEFSLEVNNKDIKHKYIVVKLHLDFENYSPCDVIYKKKNYKLVRMCPPGKVKYFFTVDGNPVYNCYKEYDYKIKEFEKPIKYTFNEEYIEQYNKIKATDLNSDENNNTIINVNKKYFGENIDIDIQKDEKDKNNKLISKTIHIRNYGVIYISPNNNIITKEYKSTLKFSIPRPDYISSGITQQDPWEYKDSIWNYYKYDFEGETDDILEKMFETDFNLVNYDSIFLNEEELNSVKQFIKENYKYIINCYVTLSSYSGDNIWQTTSEVVGNWLKEKCNNFFDKEYNINNLDKILEKIYNNNKEMELRERYKKYYPSNFYNLIRHNFVLFLVEISRDKYINYKHKTKSAYEAFKFTFDNHFIKGFQNMDNNIWRKDRYYNEEVDNYLKAFLPLIDGLFHTFSNKLGKELRMSQEDFMNFILTFINKKEFDMKEIPLIFHISKRFEVNELFNDNFIYLNFGEFCEALCRVIDIYSPYPPEDKKEDWPLEKRQEQFLIEKIENIMPTLFKKINHPKYNSIKEKFIAPLKNQITSLYIIDKNSNFYKGYEAILEQNKNNIS